MEAAPRWASTPAWRGSGSALQHYEFLMRHPLRMCAFMFLGNRITASDPAADFDEAIGDEALHVANRARLVETAHEPEERWSRHVITYAGWSSSILNN